MYPRCLTLKATLQAHGMTGNELARILQERFGRRRANNESLDGYYIQGLIMGQQYVADTLREHIAKVFDQTVKETFPEYLIECRTLQRLRLDREMSQATLAALAGDRAHQSLRGLTISAYECGHRYCHPDTREAIAAVLDLPTDTVFPEYAAFASIS